MKLSIVIAVLDSHEVTRRQILHFNNMDLPPSVEVIILDDGSEESIREYVKKDLKGNIRVYPTGDKRPWSQPCARNMGAEISYGDFLLMTDIDHIFSKDCILWCLEQNVDKAVFPRFWAILDEGGFIHQVPEKLFEYGLSKELYEERKLHAGHHANTFMMRKSIYTTLNGYDEKFCGKYGGDDTDFSRRYGELHKKGLVNKHVLGPKIYVYPNPRADVKGLFHRLR